MSNSSVVPANIASQPESSRDPLSKIIEVAKDDKLSDDDKKAIIAYAQNKFANRRRMAYTALLTMVISLFLLFVASFVDGLYACPDGHTCKGISATIKENQTLIAWIEGFLTSIVAAYYGVSAWRPAS